MNKEKTWTFTVRMPIEFRNFLKKVSIEEEKSINEIIISFIVKYKKYKEKVLTTDDFVVS